MNPEQERIRQEEERWEREVLEPALRAQREMRQEFSTLSDIPLERLYTPADVGDADYLRDVGFPGEYPFTRGVQPTMYRGRLWTMRQYAGFGTAEESNRRYKYLLAQGTSGLSVAFDLPTQMGYDSDHSMAAGEVGRVGVAIDSLRDMEMLFDGIQLSEVSTSMTINSTAAILLAMYVAVAEQQGVAHGKLRGTVQNDLLKEYIARGTYIYPPKPSMRIIVDIFDYCTRELPLWNAISISGYHIREAGSTAVQEVAFTLANAIAYVEAAQARGLEVDQFAPQLSFFFNVHNHFCEEVAKFRAARRMWARIMRERFHAKNESSWKLRFHTQTAGVSLTAQQPEVNVARVTIQALAAVAGGTQSLHTNAMDEALALPTEHAVRVALRTQQVIAHESGMADSVDPFAGSYLIESLTDEIERRAADYISQIDDIGGMLEAIERGFVQKEIQRSAYEHQMAVERGERVIVGVNQFAAEEEAPIPLFEIDLEVERRQVQKLARLRTERDGQRVETSLKRLHQAAQGTENLMPHVLECVRSYTTLGEISDALRSVFGEYQETLTL